MKNLEMRTEESHWMQQAIPILRLETVNSKPNP